MQPGSDATFAAALAWLCILVTVWFRLPTRPPSWVRNHPGATIALAAAIARLVPALTLDRGLPFDIEAHWIIGSLALDGQNVYTAPLAAGRYPYPPVLHESLSAFLVWLAQGSSALFLVLDKVAPALCGVAIAVAMWATARRLGQSSEIALLAGLLYALNPLPVLVTSYHGQFEEIPLLFIVLAILALVREPTRSVSSSNWTVIVSALLLGVAIAYKSWPVLFLPPLLLLVPRRKWYLPYISLALVPLAITLTGYRLAFGLSGLREAVKAIISYSGSDGFCWGYVSILRECWTHPPDQRPNLWVAHLNQPLLIAALGATTLLLLLRQRPLEGLVTLPLAFYLFAPGWGPNYSIWVIPGALLLSPTLANRYTLLVLPSVALTYLDSLYAAFSHDTFSWTVLKPIEAGLGLLAWIGIFVMLVLLYHPPRNIVLRQRAAVKIVAPPYMERSGIAAVTMICAAFAVTALAVAIDLSGVGTFTLDIGRRLTLDLGNDLGGGTQLLLRVVPQPSQRVDDRDVVKARQILKERVDGSLGVSEPVFQTLSRGPERLIGVQFPGTSLVTPGERMLLQETGKFTLVALNAPLRRGTPARGFPVLAGGDDIISLSIAIGVGPVQLHANPAVDLTLRPSAETRVRTFATFRRRKFIAVAMDDVIYDSRPAMEYLFGGRVQILRVWPSSSFANIDNLANILKYGPLPVHLRLIGEQSISPSVAPTTMRIGFIGAVAILSGVMLIIARVYRLVDLFADLVIAVDLLLTIATVKLFGMTLTLAGIVGLSLATITATGVGLEIVRRVHHELRAGQPQAIAIDQGFARAQPAIRNVVIFLMIACGILWWAGSSWWWGYPLAHGALVSFSLILFIGTAILLVVAGVSRTLLRIILIAVRMQPDQAGRAPLARQPIPMLMDTDKNPSEEEGKRSLSRAHQGGVV